MYKCKYQIRTRYVHVEGKKEGVLKSLEIDLTLPESIDWKELETFEKEDTTNGSRELACSADSCEVVDIVAAE